VPNRIASVAIFEHAIQDLSAIGGSNSISFSDTWKMPQTAHYRIVGSVLYDSRTSAPAVVEINKCGGGRFRADINHDCYVTFEDFALLAGGGAGGCTNCDLNNDGVLDRRDLVLFADQWLLCNDPANTRCDYCWK
jgi:hypothetical protein